MLLVQTRMVATSAHVILVTLVTAKSVLMSTNVLPTHVMSTEHALILMDHLAVLVTQVTLVTDSLAKTSTNVMLMSAVTILLALIFQEASHALALTASPVMLWRVVLTFANVVTPNSTSVMPIPCAQTSMAATPANVILDTLVMVNLVPTSTNVLIQHLYQLIQLVKILKAAS